MVAQFLFLSDRLTAPEYNCSAHSPEYWSRIHGRRQFVLGVWSVFFGCLTWVLYVPSLRYFFREKRFTCVKIMRVLALFDMTAILCVGILFGIQMLQGAVFCSHKIFIILNGLGGYACWNVSSCICLFLVINRILEMTGREHYFNGSRSAVVMIAAAVYGITIVFFFPPVITNSLYQTMHFCPFIPGLECSLYVNYAHLIHNSVICVLMTLLFTVLCVTVRSNINNLHNSSSFQKLQSKIFTQALIICIVDVRASFGWILLNVVPTPQIVITIVMIGCQFIYAAPSMIYIAMNRNVQQELRKMLGMKPSEIQAKTAFTASTVASSINVI